MKPVAVLRPEPAASATAERARALGLAVLKLPLFALEARSWEVPESRGFDGLLVTSANVIRLAGEKLGHLASLPIFAVGEATAAAARASGLDVAQVGNGGIDTLLQSLPAECNLLHLCGEDRREPLSASQRITPVVVYEAVALSGPDLSRLPGAVALVHSPRAGQRLAELTHDRALTSIAAISPAAAAACGGGWHDIAAAARPDEQALLSLAARMCQESQPE